MKTTISIVGGAAMLLASTWIAAQLPPGSYKETCTGEAVVGNVLRAKCRTMSGAMMDTSLNLPCKGSIDNINGKLACAAPPATGVPQGSYLQTCTGAAVKGTFLHAKCRNTTGMMVDTSLNLPCDGKIDNINGKLACAAAAAAGVPPGSYLQTCAGAKVANNVLTADCRRADQSVNKGATLTLPCAKRIENMNGKLACM